MFETRRRACSAHLFVSNVLGRERDWTFHGQDGQSLEQICERQAIIVSDDFRKANLYQLTVLADVSNDSELVKVSTSTFSSERLLERDLNIGNVVLVPA